MLVMLIVMIKIHALWILNDNGNGNDGGDYNDDEDENQ